MDLNIVVLCGRVAAHPEIRRFPSGSTQLRILLTVTTDTPTHRIDLIPVVLWDPPGPLTDGSLTPGTRIWVSGTVQRRFWEEIPVGEGRSGIEVVADHIEWRTGDHQVLN